MQTRPFSGPGHQFFVEARELGGAVFVERTAARQQLPTAGRAACDVAAEVMVVAPCRATVSAALMPGGPAGFRAEGLALVGDPVERELGDRAA